MTLYNCWETVLQYRSNKKALVKKFRKILGNIVADFLFINVTGQLLERLLEEELHKCFFWEFNEFFEENYPVKHLCVAASEYWEADIQYFFLPSDVLYPSQVNIPILHPQKIWENLMFLMLLGSINREHWSKIGSFPMHPFSMLKTSENVTVFALGTRGLI